MGAVSDALYQPGIMNLSVKQQSFPVRLRRSLLLVCVAISALAGTGSASGATHTTGDLTWSEDGSVATVTGCSSACPASLVIPTAFTDSGSIYPVVAISSSAFANETSLTSITIPNNVTSIGAAAFQYAINLTSVELPSSLSSISAYAFYGATSLTSITIPTSVTSISDSAFASATSLTTVTFASPSSVTSIRNSAFRDATSLTNITIPTSVTSISEYAFRGATSLTSITIPTSVTSIGWSAFHGATGLTTVTFASPSSVTSIRNSAFYGATSLTSITIPTSVTSIESSSFRYATSLSSIRFSGSAPSVGADAFLAAPATIYRFSTASGFGSDPTWNGKTLAYWLPAPTAIATDARDGTATISVTPAGFGPTPDSYRVSTVSGAGICTITPPETSCTIGYLSNGTTYTFTATASTTSPAVTSDASSPTNPVTPIATPATPTPAGTTGQTPSPVTTAAPTAAPRATATAPPRQTPTGIITTYETTGPGRLAIRVTPATGARDVRAAAPALCRASITVMGARTVALRCTYTAAARKRIHSRSLRASLVTVFTPASGAATRTLTPLTLKRQR